MGEAYVDQEFCLWFEVARDQELSSGLILLTFLTMHPFRVSPCTPSVRDRLDHVRHYVGDYSCNFLNGVGALMLRRTMGVNWAK